MTDFRFTLLAVFLTLLFSTTHLYAETPSERVWPSVELYTTEWCPYCIKTKAFFDQHHIPYKIYDVEKNREAAARKKQLAPGTGVPVVVIDGEVICGYSEKSFRVALDLDD